MYASPYLNRSLLPRQERPNKICLLALRDIIMAQYPGITAEWKYNMPFFCYKGL